MNSRNTIQRALVLKTVNELGCHVTADEVYDTIVKTHSDISRGTVYRNLKLLSERGEIRKVAIPSGADRYDHICYPHYHVMCIKCGRIFDVEMQYIINLEESITDTRGFRFEGHDIIFKGTCPDCNS